ncbi:F-box/kelch-repeat protein [Raphanus sativus]|nr:F-box/kelch-repeat protein [Raphanus sativus]
MSSTTASDSGQEPPSKKPAREATSILQLPDELVLSCLARVPRLHYLILSLTSSPELYHNRYLLNRTEKCLYVCLQFLLSLTFVGSLSVVQILNSPPVEWSNLVAVDHKLYAVGDVPCSSNSFFLDCRTHTWVETPNLRLAHVSPGLNRMMYLAGSSDNPDSLNCVEVFNTETQTWKPVPPEKRILRAGDFQGSVYENLRGEYCRWVLVANLKDGKGGLVGSGTDCWIKKRFYCYGSDREITWSNSLGGGWKKLRGLEGLPKFARYSNVKLVECGGKLVVFWDKYVPARGGYKDKMIWCAEISLETRGSEEVWGKVEWFDAVLTVPKSYKFVCASAATV